MLHGMRDRIPWARLLLGLVVVGPPLGIGGVLPWVLPAFVLGTAALAVRVCLPRRSALRLPRGLAWFAAAAAFTTLQWLPIGHGLVEVLAPGIAEPTAVALARSDLPAWSRLSVLPGATGMEAARLAALGLLFFAAAQLSWRHAAISTVVAGTAVAMVGIGHLGLGTSAVYGLYTPVEVSAFGDARVGLLTSFVNPNHQSALLLLGIAAASALLLDPRAEGSNPLRPEVSFALQVALSLQAVVLVLSLSRAALVVAFVLYGPLVLVASVRRTETARPLRLLLVVLAAAVLTAVLAGGSALRGQLETLLDPAATEHKLKSVHAGLGLIERSPWLGTGRGTAVDLLPLAREDLEPVVFTHIESFPVTLLVEWGPLVGGILLLTAAAWWVMTLRHASSTGPRILAIGILAVAAHNGLDFNLEYLGVAAPVVAVAGAISPSTGSHPPPRRALGVSVAVALAAAALALATFRSGRAALHDQHHAVARGEVAPALALKRRPLDPRLHTQLARLAADRERWDVVEHHARLATTLAPSLAAPWLLRGAAASARGDQAEASRADAAALRRAPVPLAPELLEYLTARYPPEALAELLPQARDQAEPILDALLELAPRHADAAARAWVEARPDDPFALAHRVEYALTRSNPALALHHARLYHAQAPASARATLLVTRALSSFSPPRDAEIRAQLEQALVRDDLDDPGALEEQLVHCLRRIGTAEALEQADAIVPRLLKRPAPREVLRRRQRLASGRRPRRPTR